MKPKRPRFRLGDAVEVTARLKRVPRIGNIRHWTRLTTIDDWPVEVGHDWVPSDEGGPWCGIVIGWSCKQNGRIAGGSGEDDPRCFVVESGVSAYEVAVDLRRRVIARPEDIKLVLP